MLVNVGLMTVRSYVIPVHCGNTRFLEPSWRGMLV